LIGDLATGKTALLQRFTEENFLENYKCTIGVDFKIQTLEVDGEVVKL